MHDHYVPEGYDDLNLGICARCDQPVRWNEPTDEWVVDRTLRVLVLTADEAAEIRRSVSGATKNSVEYQLDGQDMDYVAKMEEGRYD